MRVLIADDEPTARTFLEDVLGERNFHTELVADGDAAWAALCRDDPPEVAILDWTMPGPSGPELCARLRARTDGPPVYLLLLSARNSEDDVLAGLRSGANDYLTKPFREEELAARLHVACAMIHLQRRLADRVRELESALADVKQLRGMLPICAWCKKVRNDADYWQQLEDYLQEHIDAEFTHSICPSCFEVQLQQAGDPPPA